MAQNTRGSKQTEVLVIGSNMCGLLLAEAYRQQGRDVVLLEAGERYGLNHLSLDLGFIPDSGASREALKWMSNLLRAEPTVTAIEQPPVTYVDGHLQTFVGFGDHNPPARDEVSYYTANSHLEINPTLSEITAPLIAEPKFQVLTRKEVTKILSAGGQVEGVEVNGEEVWQSPEIVWTLGPSRLLEVMPLDVIDGKHRQRFAKAHSWATITLQLRHPRIVTTERGIHILYGSGHEADPVVGRYWPTLPEGGQTSAWMTLVPGESSEDPDSLSAALKHLKRQIKRAHPHVLNDLLEERLLVTAESHGHLNMKDKRPFTMAELKGFTFASPLLSDFRGTLAGIDIARRISELFETSQSASRQTNDHAPTLDSDATSI